MNERHFPLFPAMAGEDIATYYIVIGKRHDEEHDVASFKTNDQDEAIRLFLEFIRDAYDDGAYHMDHGEKDEGYAVYVDAVISYRGVGLPDVEAWNFC